MPHRHPVAALLTTRRGIISVAVLVGLCYLLLRPASTPSPSFDAVDGTPTPLRQGYLAAGMRQVVPERWREGWVNWRMPGADRLSGAAATNNDAEIARKGTQAALVEAKKTWVKVVEDEDEGVVHAPLATTADDDMFLDSEGGGGAADNRRVDPVKAAERFPAKGEKQARPFGAKDNHRNPHGAAGEGLLSPDDLDSIDKAAEEERLAASHASHASSDDGADEDLADPRDLLPEEGETYPDYGSPDDDEWTLSTSDGDGVEGAPDAGFSVEEEAEADAPSVAAHEDARMRAPMAALSGGKGKAAKEEQAVEAGGEADKVRPHVAVKGAHDDGADEQAPAHQQPPPPPPPPAAPKLVNGGKKVGTGGKLLNKGAAGGDAGGAARKPPQRVGAGEKAGAQVQQEAGRRVGTGARPGAKGMGGRVQRGRWRV